MVDQTGKDQQELARMRRQIARLRTVAAAADRASQEIDREIRTLKPEVNNMRDAEVALTTLVNLTGSVQRTLVEALNQLEAGDGEESEQG